MQTINPSFNAEGYELWIDGTAAVHIEERHGEHGVHDETMSGRDAKILIPWAAQNANNAEFIYEKGKIKRSTRFDNADHSAAPEITLTTELSDSYLYIAECVPDSQNQRLWITSAYRKVKKDSRGQLLNMEDSSLQLTPEAPDGNAINDSIPQSTPKVNSKFSLPMYPTLPDAAEVEVELNERDWGFDWSDENIRKNLAKIHEYLDQKYPNVDISITFDREKNFIAVRSVSNPVDFDELSKIDNELFEFLLSIDVKEEQIGQHLSLFRKVEDKMAVGKRLRNKSFFHSMLRRT